MLDSLTLLLDNGRFLTIDYEEVIEYLTIHDKISVQLLRSMDHDHFITLCRLLTNVEVNSFNEACAFQVEQTLNHLNENFILLHSHTAKSI